MSNITYTHIPGVTKPVSRIFFGTGDTDFLNGKNQNDLLDSIFALGINTLDTAADRGSERICIQAWPHSFCHLKDVVSFPAG